MGKEVISNVEQLVISAKSQLKIYNNHQKDYTGNAAQLKALHLLQVYAVECAVKALFLKKNFLRDTSQLAQILGVKYGHGHDLELWARELKMPAAMIHELSQPNIQFPISKLHERLRYGASIGSAEFASQIGFLKELIKLLTTENIL